MTRTAIVTGGSGGIGRAIAEALAAQGYLPVIGYRTGREEAQKTKERILSAGGQAEIFPLDVTREEDILSVFRFSESLGRTDLLVNCAGVADFRQIQDVEAGDIERIFSVNSTAVILACREAARLMIPRGEGCIVNISSMWGVTGASCESVYAASKAAVIAFSRSLAAELGPSGIRVNCIAPGVIDTPMNARLSAEEMAELAASTPLGRIGRPEDVAGAVSFLAGADFVTGQCITVDGGFTL